MGQFLHAVCASLLNESDARCAHDWHHLKTYDSYFHQWKNFVILSMQSGGCPNGLTHRTTRKHGFPFTTWKAWYASYIHEWGNINMLLLHRRTASGTQPRFSCVHCRRAGNVSVNFTVNECSSPVCFIPMSASVYGISSNKMERILRNYKPSTQYLSCMPFWRVKYFPRWLWTLYAFVRMVMVKIFFYHFDVGWDTVCEMLLPEFSMYPS